MTATVQHLQGQGAKRTLLPPSGANWPEVVPAQVVPALDTLCIGLFLSRADLAHLISHSAVSGFSGLLEVSLEGALGMSF